MKISFPHESLCRLYASLFLSFSLPGPSHSPSHHLSFLSIPPALHEIVASCLAARRATVEVRPRQPADCWFFRLRAGRCVNSAGSVLNLQSAAALIASRMPWHYTFSHLGCRPARLLAAALIASWMQPCSPLGCRPARLLAAALLTSWMPSCSPLGCRPARLSAAALLAFWLPPCSPLGCRPARLSDAVLLASRMP